MRRFSIASLIGIAAFGLIACQPKTDVAAATPAAPGPVAPSWHLNDPDGKPVSSDQFKGKVVVIDFWATWCPPCRREIPGYIDLQRKYGKDGLVFIGVSLDRNTSGKPANEIVKKFIQAKKINYLIVMADPDGNTEKAFGGLEGIPTTFLIDRDGYIRDRKLGAVETSEYERRILAVLKPADQ